MAEEANKVDGDQHLLARVLDDARLAVERGSRATFEHLQEILLRNEALFEKYKELTGGRHLLAYFARFGHPNAGVAAADLAAISALCEQTSEISNLDLLVHSPGGAAETAEKLAAACRAMTNGEFRVVVPSMAKSAATMLACCSDQIIMGYLSELGPIDPQIEIEVGGQRRFVSAQSFIDGQTETLRAFNEASQRGEPILGYGELLHSQDMSPAWMAEMKRQIKFGQRVVANHLKVHMLPRLHKDLDSRSLGRKATSIAGNLSQANMRQSHGAMIGADEALKIGLDVEILDRGDPVWKTLWEIYVRLEIFAQSSPVTEQGEYGVAKVFADSRSVQIVV